MVKVLTRDSGILVWCFTNRPKLFLEPVQLPKIGTSNHFSVLLEPCASQTDRTQAKVIYKRDLRESRMREFGSWITRQDWSEILSTVNVSEKFDKFHTTLSSAVIYFLPYKRVKVSGSDKPWITANLKMLIIKRQKALRVYGNNSDLFKHLRNKVQSAVRQCKKSFYRSKVEALKESNISRWWKEIKGLTGGNKNTEWFHQMLNENTPCVGALAERFNTFLCSLTSHFAPLQTETDLTLEVPSEFLIHSRSAFKALSEIKTRKSSGSDNIPSKVLKLFAFELAPVIADLYNASLAQGVVPDKLKTSLVIPIPQITPPKTVEED